LVKKFFWLLLTLPLIALFVACGGGDDDDGQADQTEQPAGDDDDGGEGEPTATEESDGDEDESTPTATPTEDTGGGGDDGGAGSSAADPVPLGDSVVIAGRMEAQVVEVNLDAEEAVLQESALNEATPGKDMVLITLLIENVGDGPLDAFFDPYFYLIGDNEVEYDEFDPSCGLVPDELEGELAPGDSLQGNVCVQADEDDSGLVFFIEMTPESGGEDDVVYFDLGD
jgi:hypothetical protein